MGLVKSIEENTADVFGDIGLMSCEPVKIEHTDNTKPYCVNAARKFHFLYFLKWRKNLTVC